MTGEATAVATASGSTEAECDRLSALFDRHHHRLYRLARRLSRGSDDARDLVQETFLRAARAPASIPNAPHDEAWLSGGGRRRRAGAWNTSPTGRAAATVRS